MYWAYSVRIVTNEMRKYIVVSISCFETSTTWEDYERLFKMSNKGNRMIFYIFGSLPWNKFDWRMRLAWTNVPPFYKSPLWWGRTFPWSGRRRTGRWGQTCRRRRTRAPPPWTPSLCRRFATWVLTPSFLRHISFPSVTHQFTRQYGF